MSLRDQFVLQLGEMSTALPQIECDVSTTGTNESRKEVVGLVSVSSSPSYGEQH